MSASEILVVLQKIVEKDVTSHHEFPETEKDGLSQFCQLYHGQRHFSQLHQYRLFQELLQLLKCHRLTEEWLVGRASPLEQVGHVHAVLMTLRLLLRDEYFQHLLMGGRSDLRGMGDPIDRSDPLPTLAQSLAQVIEVYFSPAQGQGDSHQCTTDLLKELTNIFQKVSNCVAYRQQLVDAGVHSLLIQLLWSHDLVPLQCSLCALINLCKTESVSVSVAALDCAPPLLHIISSYDTVSRHLASDLLLLLSQHSKLKEQIRNSDSLPACLRVLHSNDLHLLHRMVGVVERLAESSDYQDEFRLLGGLPLLLGILSKHVINESHSKETQNKLIALRAICCSALTQLVLNDSNAQLIVQSNGVYLIACNILPLSLLSDNAQLQENLQKYALRALRYLFSMERNRRIFKKLFPPGLFEAFIDIGHYRPDLSAYSQLMHTINTLPESERAVMLASIDAINQSKAPIFSVGGYAVLELLGSGAFGSVYKVRKQNSDVFLAMKEIRSSHPSLGHTLVERSSTLGRLLNEVNIIREQLRHPNVVRYHKCFQENDHLYIVMELLEGAPLNEHISSLGEKGLKFTEERIWKIFIQLVLALRYIHKEKKIIHRDLSPANLMLGEGDKLTITDFGLAKQKQREFSVTKSVVGTMLYWCPELVEGEPYNEKADIWAAGCILYQMATLHPPFQSTNLLALAKKIAEVDYPPITDPMYSLLLSEVVSKCLTAESQLRADSVQLGSLLAAVMMANMDAVALNNETLERKLAKEKQKTVRHYHKAMWSERRYQQLISTSSDTLFSSQARRKLSSSFTAPHSVNHDHTNAPGSDTTVMLEGRTKGEEFGEENHLRELTSDRELGILPQGDPLQCSSDSVFGENEMRYMFPTNWEQPASPQVLRGCGRPNPLTSHTAIGRVRTQSSGEIPSTSWTRKTSGVGPLSSLAIGQKSRTPSASSLLSISPKHLREITDPILVLLTQLHKLVFVSQLPPSPTPSARWTILQIYKRQLFSCESSGVELKKELYKLVSGTSEAVVCLCEQSRVIERAITEMREVGCEVVEHLDKGYLSYETLQEMIEGLTVEHGYYQTTSDSKHHS